MPIRASLLAAGALAALATGMGCSGGESPAVPAPPSPSSAAAPAENGALLFTRPAGDAAWQRYELLAANDRARPATRFARRLFPSRSVDVSPDGRTVAFTRPARRGPGGWRLSTPHDIFLAPVAGGPTIRLERTRTNEQGPRFSDDGRWLSFSYPTSIESGRVGIIEIADRGGRDVLAAPGDEYGYGWEPGTHRILFSHGSFLNGEYALYLTDADTAEATRVPNTEDLYGASWTPTGRLFAVTTDESKGPVETSIWLMEKNGADRRLVATTHGRPNFGIAFAPGDEAIAAGLDFRDAGERIVVAELGDEAVELTADAGVPGWSPIWSPDGSTIAFLRGRSVWLMDGDGGNPRRVPGSRGAEHLVAWLAEPAG